ncbi:BLUF domain-containing protein [Sphingomonas sp. BK069]|uniref:BLUF domain-containing protein n=1 Tax=Sphingomonas sp. BK069 TaxID=2586979 RepID=UPI00161856FC|nr:BLUF domain-containing protein [Sphingomonas sp. BK069]MBB3349842.1 hypothetical protein [Sphingomonas sp. BK069]
MASNDIGALRRLIYTSRATDHDLVDILRVSRANNGIDGISGLLLAKQGMFVQVLEGPPESVATTFERIRRDDRHSHVEVLSDTAEKERAFGDWTMAALRGEDDASVRERLAVLTAGVPAPIRTIFKSS